MATIGTFKKTDSNEFTGEIVTLSVQAKGVRIVQELELDRKYGFKIAPLSAVAA